MPEHGEEVLGEWQVSLNFATKPPNDVKLGQMLPNFTIILLLKPGVKRSYQGMLTSYMLFIQAFVYYSI